MVKETHGNLTSKPRIQQKEMPLHPHRQHQKEVLL